MKKKAPQEPDISKKLAEPARKAAQELLQHRLRSKESREEVAKALGKSIHTVNALLYKGQGGFDLMIAALIVAYGLHEDSFSHIVHKFEQVAFEKEPSSDIDRLWRRLDLDDRARLKWIKTIETYLALSKP